MKKAIALTLAGAMSVGLLAGCGGAASSSASSSSAASTEASSTAEAASTTAAAGSNTVNTTDPIELTMSWWGGDSRHEAYQAAIKAFEAKYPNITVTSDYGAWSGWEEKQSTALTAGNAADVMQVNWNWLYQYSATGQSFQDLNQYSDVLDLTQWDASPIEACTVANELQCVPVAMTGRIFYWNMNTFKQAGITEVPKTLDDLMAAGTAFAALGDDYYPLSIGAYDRMILMTFYLESKYGTPWVSDGTLNYTAEQITEGIEFIKSLEDGHVIPTVEQMKGAGFDSIDKSEQWIDGRYAGIFEWDSAASKYLGALSDNTGFTVGDEIKFGDKANGGFSKVSLGLAITETCEHPVEAAALINFLLNEEEGASIMGTQCGLVASKAGLAAAEAAGTVNELVKEANGKVMAFVDQPFDPYYESTSLKDTTEGIYTDVFEGYSYGDYDAAEAAQILIDGVNEAIGA